MHRATDDPAQAARGQSNIGQVPGVHSSTLELHSGIMPVAAVSIRNGFGSVCGNADATCEEDEEEEEEEEDEEEDEDEEHDGDEHDGCAPSVPVPSPQPVRSLT